MHTFLPAACECWPVGAVYDRAWSSAFLLGIGGAPAPSLAGRVAERFRASKLPSLEKEGWTRHQTNGAKPPLKERTGWFVQLPVIGDFNKPPRLRRLRWLRKIFLWRSHPSLSKEGSLLALNRSATHPTKEGEPEPYHPHNRKNGQTYNGRRMVNVEPWPTRLVTLMLPAWLSMACLTMDKPNPVPPDSRVLALSTR